MGSRSLLDAPDASLGELGDTGNVPTSRTAHKARAVAGMSPAPVGNRCGGVLGWKAKVLRGTEPSRGDAETAPGLPPARGRGCSSPRSGGALLVGATRPPKPPRDPQNPTGLHGELRSLAGSSGRGRLSGGSGGICSGLA